MTGSLLDHRRFRAIAPTLGLVLIFSGATLFVPLGIALVEHTCPYDNFAWMPDGAKVVCMALMLLGRLEIFTFAVVFMPSFWRR